MSSNHFASASLYVGDLNPSVTETHLYEVFNAVASVASVRVCRDTQTRQSLGYAYVNYHTVQDAERAMDRLNFANIRGQPCRIMWCNRDPSIRRSGDGNVFVKNLDKSLDNKALYDTFSVFGNILSCKIGTGENGESLGYGFVHFETEEAAQKAIQRANGLTLANKPVYVGSFVPKADRMSVKEQVFTNVYVKNFPLAWTREDLDKLFSEFGAITSSVLRTDPRGRNFGFVNFEENAAARAAIKSLNGRVFEDDKLLSVDDSAKQVAENPEIQTLYVSRSMSRPERQQFLREQHSSSEACRAKHSGENLYVKNLPEEVDNTQLLEMFTPFGPITSAKVMTDEKGKSRGFGFICFHSAEDAARAVTDMHGKLVSSKPLYVTIAEKREHRAARLQSRFRGPRPPGVGFPPATIPPGAMPQYMYPMARPVGNYMWRPQQQRMMNFAHQPAMPGMPGMPPVPGMGQPSSVDVQSLRRELREAPVEHHKQLIGEKLYRVVVRSEPEAAGKITGMMLEIGTDELLRLMESETELRLKINEARHALDQLSRA